MECPKPRSGSSVLEAEISGPARACPHRIEEGRPASRYWPGRPFVVLATRYGSKRLGRSRPPNDMTWTPDYKKIVQVPFINVLRK
jgi:hypothetical protein